MIDTFVFQVHTHLWSGVGKSRELPTLLDGMGATDLVLLVDEAVSRSSYYGEILSLLKNSGKNCEIILLRGGEEPDYDYLDAVAEKVRAFPKVDLLLGIGGGSALDIAKAVAALRTNPGKGIEYRGFDKVVNAAVPTLLIPTTAGTGSEVTINAVFTDKKEMKKLGINGRYMHATYALLDSMWTESCPISVAVSAGMDAMTHTLESFMCHKANALTRSLSREAFRLLFRNLPALKDAPEDAAKRQNILLGAYLAGMALFNSGSGISGALSYPLGVHFKIPHGIGGGIFLPSVVAYNVERGYTDYAELFDMVESEGALSKEEKSRRFVGMIRDLADYLDVPRHLDAWGVTKANVDEAAKLMLPLQAAFDQNPIPFSAESDARDMLRRHVVP